MTDHPHHAPQAGKTAAAEREAPALVRVLRVIDALPPGYRMSEDTPLRDALPGIWPTVADLRAFVAVSEQEHHVGMRRLFTEREFVQFLNLIEFPRDCGFTFSKIASLTGLNDEAIRQVMSGKRSPSKAVAEACGFERIVMFRKKTSELPAPRSTP